MPLFQPKSQIVEKSDSSRLTREFIDWAEVVVTSIIAVVILFTFVFRVVGIDGPSMMNTLNDTYGQEGHTNDMVIISHMFYKPERGDIVVVSRNWSNEEFDLESTSQQPIVKRVIAIAGDKIEINYETGRVWLNDEELSEPYIRETILESNRATTPMPYILREGQVFLMGDNRNRSQDSRDERLGPVDERYILGKVVMRVFPLNKIKLF